MRKVVGAREMRDIERRAVAHGITLASLMEHAGSAVAYAAAEMAGDGKILVLAGPGNNGGDGVVAAEQLRRAGYDVTVYEFHRAGPGPYEGRVERAEDDPAGETLQRLVATSAVIVDALLGIGQTRPPEGQLASIVRTVRRARNADARILAVDIPTGVDADSGAVSGEAIHADVTLCMGYLKLGILLSPGREHAGELRTVDVGIPAELDRYLRLSVPYAPDIARILPVRRLDGNKGAYGRLIVAGGSRDFVGAPAMVAEGAYRIGAGLVELAVVEEVQRAVAARTLESVYQVVPDSSGQLSQAAVPYVEQALARASAVVLGPGMGSSDDTLAFTAGMLRALEERGVPTVVDADGLNSLARMDGWWSTRAQLILTPHPGEMVRLTGRPIQSIQASRIDTAVHYAARWQKVVVLKGAGTIVAAPTGQAVLNPTGGPNLATAGTGDVLSGMIGGLLAQGVQPFEAAIAGAYLHGRAGDLIRSRLGSAGTVASDLPAAVPEVRVAVLREAEMEMLA